MKNQELKGLSIEELQQRNEFSTLGEDYCCEGCCPNVNIPHQN